jgi:hypothetical protein
MESIDIPATIRKDIDDMTKLAWLAESNRIERSTLQGAEYAAEHQKLSDAVNPVRARYGLARFGVPIGRARSAY